MFCDILIPKTAYESFEFGYVTVFDFFTIFRRKSRLKTYCSWKKVTSRTYCNSLEHIFETTWNTYHVLFPCRNWPGPSVEGGTANSSFRCPIAKGFTRIVGFPLHQHHLSSISRLVVSTRQLITEMGTGRHLVSVHLVKNANNVVKYVYLVSHALATWLPLSVPHPEQRVRILPLITNPIDSSLFLEQDFLERPRDAT